MAESFLSSSELILNPNGSIYHLNLLPEQLADTIITVGDPDRVREVSKLFDNIEVQVQKREFKTHTGTLNGKRISVVSTGIGTDNIDIVINELDALKNIDFKTRKIKEEFKPLDIIRLGTSGSIQPDIDVDSFIISERAIGFDGLLHFYQTKNVLDEKFSEAFIKHTLWSPSKATPYVINAAEELLAKFPEDKFLRGITATNIGFYGPQGRKLRLALSDDELNEKIKSFRFKDRKITNMEMETSGIYGLSRLLGHRAVSLNAIVANRSLGTFSKSSEKTINSLIKNALSILTA